MSDSQVSVGAAMGYAWSLWRTHWRDIWGVLALNAVACTVFFAGVFTSSSDIAAAGSAGLLLTTFPVYGAMMRLAFAGENGGDDEFRLGAMGLQWRRMEARLFFANLLLMLFLVLVFVVATGITTLVLGGIMAAKLQGHPMPPPSAMTADYVMKLLGPGVTEAAAAVIQMVLIFVMFRLALYIPATACTRKVSVLRTWKLTRGHFWQILLCNVVIGLPTFLIMIFGSGAGLALNGQPSALAPGETFFYSLICGGWAGAAAMPLAAGVQAYFYRNLKAD